MGNFIIGLKVTAIGFSTVFVVLTILMFIIMAAGSFMSGLGKKSEAAPKVATAAPQAAAAPAPAPAKQDDTELIAVIAAAIAACGGSTKAVKSITRINGTAGAAWSAASRADAMNNL